MLMMQRKVALVKCSAGSLQWGIPPVTKVMRKEARQNAKAWSSFRGSPWVFLNIYPPKPESACLIVLCFPLFWHSLEKVNSGLQLTVSCIWKECFSSNPFDGALTCLTVGDLYNLWIVYSPQPWEAWSSKHLKDIEPFRAKNSFGEEFVELMFATRPPYPLSFRHLGGY